MRLLLQLLTGGVAATLGDTAPEPGHVVTSLDGATKLTLGPAGGLTSLSIRGVALQLLPAGSGVWLDGALASGHGAAASPIVGGGVAFTRELTFGAKKQHTAEVVEKFMPAESGAVEWSLVIKGTSPKMFAPGINVSLAAAAADATNWSVWAPWATPGCDASAGAECENCDGRGSPLQAQPLRCFARSSYPLASYSYGSGTSVPLVALLGNPADIALSLSAAPDTHLLQSAAIATSIGGDQKQPTLGIAFAAAYRVSSTTPALTLRFHIAGGQACTRDVLRLYSTRDQDAFEPPNRNVHYRASGMGSYAATQPPLTQVVDGAPLVDTLRTVGYKVNWDATFWWPYIMMIAPTIAKPNNFTEPWGSSFDKVIGYNNRLSTVHVKSSYAIREEYLKHWADANLTVLGYFNGWELGQQMVDYPPTPTSCPDEVDLWRSAPCFIHKYLDSALCTSANGKRNVGKGQSGWDGDTELDPGTPLYRNFLKTMVQNSLDMLPSFMGLASDGIRACTNYAGDDNITCLPSGNDECAPVQDGFTAWASLMEEVGPMLHNRDKLFSANTVNGPRVHLFRHVDLAITEESAHDPHIVALNSWIALRKPAVMWTTQAGTTDGGAQDYDGFFQRLLHSGLFPMPPMPHGDHSLNNGSMPVHQAFMDYAPLFKGLNGRVWALRPHAVSIRELSEHSLPDLHDQASVPPSTLTSELGDNQATLTSCQGLPTQLWTNKSLSGGEPGSGGLLQLAGDRQHRCLCRRSLCVYNPSFTTSQCSTADDSQSQIWVFEGPESEPAADESADSRPAYRDHERERTKEGSGDCPKHENVLWAVQRISESAAPSTTALLRSAVPVPTQPLGIKRGGLCLTSNASHPGSGALGLAPCSGADPAQHWSVLPAAAGLVQLGQLASASKQQLCITAPKPPPPPPPPPLLGIRSPIVALFEDQDGAQLAVVTSPGSNRPNNTKVEITIRGLNSTGVPVATSVCPGEEAPKPLASVRRSGPDVVATVTLQRGAALLRVVSW